MPLEAAFLVFLAGINHLEFQRKAVCLVMAGAGYTRPMTVSAMLEGRPETAKIVVRTLEDSIGRNRWALMNAATGLIFDGVYECHTSSASYLKGTSSWRGNAYLIKMKGHVASFGKPVPPRRFAVALRDKAASWVKGVDAVGTNAAQDLRARKISCYSMSVS
ncbi:hypothetical protein K490DRAFT_53575 [Saccharata proteae CBS 121410]|uniref:Uncharacterized protein n=1 Tax=Saccharata proteae CBS 121410 TaxID=1314787 RepID=A0A9P4HWP0_9PEZI|nr:hypothetical protein K490DRAFT_53575 [Saccharata proteae CBS 121410]